jgi:hypothetical protein
LFFETGSHYVAQAGLKLEILLLQLSEYQDTDLCYRVWKYSTSQGIVLHYYGWLKDPFKNSRQTNDFQGKRVQEQSSLI